jgi:hypothetical protein
MFPSQLMKIHVQGTDISLAAGGEIRRLVRYEATARGKPSMSGPGERGDFTGTQSLGEQFYGSGEHKRRELRFPLSSETVFWWWDRDGNYMEAKGISRDVGLRGAFVLAQACPPVGVTVGLAVSLPTYSDLGGVLRLAGRVIRVNRDAADESTTGFAVSGSRIVFVESDDEGDRAN